MHMSNNKNIRHINKTTIPEARLGPFQHLRSSFITKIAPPVMFETTLAMSFRNHCVISIDASQVTSITRKMYVYVKVNVDKTCHWREE